MTLKDTTIQALIAAGAKRWTKGNHDRLYIKEAIADVIDLQYNTYKSGQISSAKLNGLKTANAAALRILDTITRAYIDMKTNALIIADCKEKNSEGWVNVTEIIENHIAEMEKAQDATPEQSTETATTATTDTTNSVAEATETVKEDNEMTLDKIKAMTQDELTNYTGCLEDGDGHTYLTLVIPVDGQKDIYIKSRVNEDDFTEADTPEYYATWERHLPGMLKELQAELAAR